MLFSSKKAMELSINMVVVIILGIILLVMGIYLATTLVDTSIDLNQEISTELQNELIKSYFNDGKKVAILKPSLDIERGSYEKTVLGFEHDHPVPQDYYVHIQYMNSSPVNDELLAGGTFQTDTLFLNEFKAGSSTAITLNNDQREFTWIAISPPKHIPRGTYLFDVVVCRTSELLNVQQPPCEDGYEIYKNKQRIFVNVK